MVNLCIHEKIILNWILKKHNDKLWIMLMSLRTESDG